MRALVRETRLSADNFIYPLVRPHRGRPAARSRLDAGCVPAVGRRSRARSGGGEERTAFPACCSSACRMRRMSWDRRRLRSGSAGAGGDRGRSSRKCPELLVVTDVCLCEYTVTRPLRHPGGRRDRQRRHRRAAGARGALARGGRRRRRRALRHDGWPRRSHPVGAGRRGLHADRDHVVCGKVLFGVLRPVPRGGRFGAGIRRSPLAPDGSRQRRGSHRAKSRSISRKGPTSSWSSRRWRIST